MRRSRDCATSTRDDAPTCRSIRRNGRRSSRCSSSSRGSSRSWEIEPMDWKLEVIILPVTDVDRAKDFYAKQIGFNRRSRPCRVGRDPRSCSSRRRARDARLRRQRADRRRAGQRAGVALVVDDIEAAREQLLGTGSRSARSTCSRGGISSYFSDPDGNRWTVQYLPNRNQPQDS